MVVLTGSPWYTIKMAYTIPASNSLATVSLFNYATQATGQADLDYFRITENITQQK